MAEDETLPALPAWQARSFWVTVVGAAAQIAVFARFDLFGLFGVEGSEPLVDGIMQIVAAVSLFWVWFERKTPKSRLSLTGEKG